MLLSDTRGLGDEKTKQCSGASGDESTLSTKGAEGAEGLVQALGNLSTCAKRVASFDGGGEGPTCVEVLQADKSPQAIDDDVFEGFKKKYKEQLLALL